jgi:hypothetical protein
MKQKYAEKDLDKLEELPQKVIDALTDIEL